MVTDRELAEVCESELARLVGMLALYTGDEQVAQELAQDALLKLCEHWSSVRDGNPAAWLTTVAMNLGRSMFRRRLAVRRARVRHGPPDDQVVDDRADVLAVRQAVAALPQRQREVIIHRFYLRASVNETAEAMGCAAGTVKSLTNRAVVALRAAGLDPGEPDDDPPAASPPRPRHARSTVRSGRSPIGTEQR